MTSPFAQTGSIIVLTSSLVASAACSAGVGEADPNAGSGGSANGSGSAGSGDMRDTGPNGVPIPDMNNNYLFPDVAHTGFDGKHVFRVPVSTRYENVVWSIVDPSIADIVAVPTPAPYATYGRSWAMVTAKKPGKTQVKAEFTREDGGRSIAFAGLLVASYTDADVAEGDKRYNRPDNPAAAQRPSCASCHQQAGGHDHSPVVLGWYDDDNVLAAITTGAYKSGRVLMGVNHIWNLTDAEKKGILPYLRTLPPRSF